MSDALIRNIVPQKTHEENRKWQQRRNDFVEMILRETCKNRNGREYVGDAIDQVVAIWGKNKLNNTILLEIRDNIGVRKRSLTQTESEELENPEASEEE